MMSDGSNEYLAPNDDEEMFCFFLDEKDRACGRGRGFSDAPTNNTTKMIVIEIRTRRRMIACTGGIHGHVGM